MALTKIKGSILSDEIYRRENNLNDVLDKAIARNNLSVYSKTESDGRYLDEAANLSDLPNTGTARRNLSVYSKAEVDSRLSNIPPSIWVGEIRRFSLPIPPPGFFALDGSLITNGAIDYKSLIDSGCLFITVEGNNIRLFDQQHFGRGKGASGRAVGQYQDDASRPITGHLAGCYRPSTTYYGESSGVFAIQGPTLGTSSAAGSQQRDSGFNFDISRVAPVSDQFQPKSYTELVCIYHGVI